MNCLIIKPIWITEEGLNRLYKNTFFSDRIRYYLRDKMLRFTVNMKAIQNAEVPKDKKEIGAREFEIAKALSGLYSHINSMVTLTGKNLSIRSEQP